MNYTTIPSDKIIAKVAGALTQNGIKAVVAENANIAKEKVLELMPADAQVMNMSSTTLDTTSITQVITDSEKFQPVKNKLSSAETPQEEKKKLGAAPGWAVGSVHAVTENGQVLIASNTGSQLPAYAYGADHVIWVVGAQKIVKNLDQGLKRIYEHSLPLESERAKKAYGVPGSAVNKILIINQEVTPDRITLILVKEVLGF